MSLKGVVFKQQRLQLKGCMDEGSYWNHKWDVTTGNNFGPPRPANFMAVGNEVIVWKIFIIRSHRNSTNQMTKTDIVYLKQKITPPGEH